MAVIAYYSGNSKAIDNYQVKKLTHIIYSFCHLKGNRLNVDNANDTATIKKLVSLKATHPKLKVLLSLGGWGGCEFCSPVFATEAGRDEFAKSVKEVNDYFQTDGIDLDWEYPAIEGYPGHKYQSSDKGNFTALVKSLRTILGDQHEISFAAGGFNDFLRKSIDWKEVMSVVNYVNLMSYDLVNGFSTSTGHHTPLYSTSQQMESTDNAIRYLTTVGVPANKIVIGSAFYARTWERAPAKIMACTNRVSLKVLFHTGSSISDCLLTAVLFFTGTPSLKLLMPIMQPEEPLLRLMINYLSGIKLNM